MTAYQQYKKEIAKYPLLTPEEERDLLERAHDGDRAAREKLINSNLRLVISAVYPYIGQADIMDLIQQGNLGLIYSVDHFDLSRGTRFSTAATWGIKKYLSQWINQQNTIIRRPQWATEALAKLKQIDSDFQAKGLTPTISDYATITGMAPESIERLLKNSQIRIQSMDASLFDDGATLEETIPDDSPEPVDTERLKKAIECALTHLPDEDRILLARRFGVCGYSKASLGQIAKEQGVTRERISQKEKMALRRLRHPDILAEIRKHL